MPYLERKKSPFAQCSNTPKKKKKIGWGGHVELGAFLICVLDGNGRSIALWREERIAYLCREQLRVLLHSTLDKVEHNFNAPTTLYPSEDLTVPNEQKAGWSQSRSKRSDEKNRFLHPGI
jgi:hypothetical protein